MFQHLRRRITRVWFLASAIASAVIATDVMAQPTEHDFLQQS